MFQLQKPWIKKTYAVKGMSTQEIVLTNEEIGITDTGKVVVPPFLEWYGSIPSTNNFVLDVHWAYRTQIRIYTTYPQSLWFTLAWYETE